MSIFFRSSVMSVSENALMQSYAPFTPDRHRHQPERVLHALGDVDPARLAP